jgi:hypothetical protein
MTKHTPTPWIMQGSMNSNEVLIGTEKFWEYNGKKEPRPMQYGEEIAMVKLPGAGCLEMTNGKTEQCANAEFIVTAVNGYGILVDCIEKQIDEAVENANGHRRQKDYILAELWQGKADAMIAALMKAGARS